MDTPKREIPLSEAALRLGKSWNQTWRLVLKKQIIGRKTNGRWLCDVESVEALLRAETPM